MKNLIPILLFLIPLILIGQNKTELEIIEYHQKIYNGLLDDKPTPNYLFPIVRADSLLKKCSGTQFESLANQSLSWYFSYVGEYKKALELDSKDAETREISAIELIDLTKYKPDNAKKKIVASAKNFDYILINEAHHKPQHRVFANSLLDDLMKQGYKTLAIEGIGLDDKIVNTTKIPTENIGGLTMEPNYANLIRDALALGYEILPYDYDDVFDFEKRDSIGALRIIEHRKKNPEKVIVFCGYDHVDKTQKSLAYWLELNTNKKVLSVNQTRYSEEFEKKYESPYYQMATDLHNQKTPFVLNRKKQYFKENDGSDFFVFHPRVNYKNSVASWLIDYDNKKTLVKLPKEIFNKIDEFSLVQVFLKNEFEIGIPIYQFLYTQETEIKVVIPNGDFVLKVENKERRELIRIDFKYDLENGLEFD